MLDWRVLAAIVCVGLVSYAMRTLGFLVAGILPAGGPVQRVLRLAPGNLFVAFVAAGCLEGGAPSIAGALAALIVMALTRQEWAALITGFATAGIVAAVFR